LIKRGIVFGKQRYQCKDCGYYFRAGDNRTNAKIAAKKALCVLFYAKAKGSFRMLGHLFGVHHTQVYRWIRNFGESLPEPVVPENITELEFDELWHFVGQKKETLGSQSR
jgi:transposase-like protein